MSEEKKYPINQELTDYVKTIWPNGQTEIRKRKYGWEFYIPSSLDYEESWFPLSIMPESIEKLVRAYMKTMDI